MVKVSRLAEQSKQAFMNNRSNSTNSYDVNSNLQPNINPFQSKIPKEKPNLTLPVTSMSMPSKSTISTPQVVKDVEKLLEQNDLKLEQSSTQNLEQNSNNDTGFDENIRFYGEYLKNRYQN